MGRLLKFEFFKLRKKTSFYVCTGILLGLILLSAVLARALSDVVAQMMADPDLDPAMMEGLSMALPLKGAEGILAALSISDFSLMTVIFTAIFWTEDFTAGTLKNVLAKGYTREQVYLSKLVALAAATLVMMLVCFFGTFGVYSLFFGVGSFRGNTLLSLVSQIVVNLGYTALAVLLSALMKKIAPVVVTGLFGPGILSILLNLVDVNVLRNTNVRIADYWLDNLALRAQSSADSKELLICLVAGVAYVALSVVLGWLATRKVSA